MYIEFEYYYLALEQYNITHTILLIVFYTHTRRRLNVTKTHRCTQITLQIKLHSLETIIIERERERERGHAYMYVSIIIKKIYYTKYA